MGKVIRETVYITDRDLSKLSPDIVFKEAEIMSMAIQKLENKLPQDPNHYSVLSWFDQTYGRRVFEFSWGWGSGE